MRGSYFLYIYKKLSTHRLFINITILYISRKFMMQLFSKTKTQNYDDP